MRIHTSAAQKPVPNPLELAVLHACGRKRWQKVLPGLRKDARRVRIVLHPLSGVARPGAMDAT